VKLQPGDYCDADDLVKRRIRWPERRRVRVEAMMLFDCCGENFAGRRSRAILQSNLRLGRAQ